MQTIKLQRQRVAIVLVCIVVLASCGNASASSHQSTQQVTPTLTSITTTTVSQPQETPRTQATTAPTPTLAPSPSAAVTITSASLPKAFLDQLPKDKKGRVIGGPVIPYLNYSPALVTGKKCPRLTKWTWKIVSLTAPLRSYGQADDACVIQNAVDDFVYTEFADPAANTPDTIKVVEKVYKTDPAIANGLSPQLRDGQWQAYLDGKVPYTECDKPLFKLLDANTRTPLVANNDGTVSGNAIELTVFRVAQNVDSYTCVQRSYKDNSVIRLQNVTEAQLRGKRQVLKVLMVWNAASQYWRATSMYGVEVDNYYAKAKELWDAAPIKP